MYLETHHIVPKSFGIGGEKDKENLVQLTAKEHYIVHCLLPKFINNTQFKKKMEYALWYMSTKNTGYTPSSGSYTRAREIVVKNINLRNDSELTRAKKSNAGSRNGMYGKTHTIETKKIIGNATTVRLNGKSYNDLYGIDTANIIRDKKSISMKSFIKHNPEIRSKSNNGNAKIYEITDPNGLVYTVSGSLKNFCKTNSVNCGKIIDIAKGRILSYKGWFAKIL